MTATRRLAAILAADVAGYSRLIGADEQGTLTRLKAIRSKLMDPQIAAHHGRIVKTTGDGLLVEFGSTVDALRCAGEVQAQMAERNAAAVPEGRIEWRIGIHQGDIVVEDGDIFGDGVNIAARLAGCGKTRRLEKIAQKSARNQKSGPVKSMGYRNAEGHGLLRKQHRPTFSATC
jgi:adenylate cyclase